MVPEGPPTVDTYESVSPSTADAAKLVPSSDGEDAESKEFGEGPVELSLFPIYQDHTTKHIWD